MGALTMLPLRMLFSFGTGVVICIFVRILTIGMQFNENKPLEGIRVKIIKGVFKAGSFIVLMFAGVIPK